MTKKIVFCMMLWVILYFNSTQIFGQEIKLYKPIAKPCLTKLYGQFVINNKDISLSIHSYHVAAGYHQPSPNIIKNLVYLSSYHQYPPQTYGQWEVQPFMGDNYLEVFASIASSLLWNSLDRKIWK